MVNSGKVNFATDETIFLLENTTNMCLVDKLYMQLTTVECVRNSIKSYKKLFFYLLDVTLLNVHNMYLVQTGNNSLTLTKFKKKCN